MARPLPWLKTETTSTSTPSKPHHKVLRPSQTSRRNPSPDVVRADRTPSTSPPPPAPNVEFMLNDGSDDKWVMVEDELLSTAGLFARHIHHAEYQRLKQDVHKGQAAKSPLRAVANSAPMTREMKVGKRQQQRHSKRPKHDLLVAGDQDPTESSDDVESGKTRPKEIRLRQLLSGCESRVNVPTKSIANVRSKPAISESIVSARYLHHMPHSDHRLQPRNPRNAERRHDDDLSSAKTESEGDLEREADLDDLPYVEWQPQVHSPVLKVRPNTNLPSTRATAQQVDEPIKGLLNSNKPLSRPRIRRSEKTPEDDTGSKDQAIQEIPLFIV